MCHFVLVVFSPFSIAITSLWDERANLSAFRTFVRFVLVWICRFPLPLGVWEELRFVIVALPGLFSYLFFFLSRTSSFSPVIHSSFSPVIHRCKSDWVGELIRNRRYYYFMEFGPKTNLNHINLLEMMVITLALKQAHHHIINSSLSLNRQHNRCSLSSMTRLNSFSRSLSRMRNTLIWCQQNKICLIIRHIPGKFNILADHLS